MRGLHVDAHAAPATRSLPVLPSRMARQAPQLTQPLPSLRFRPLEVAHSQRHQGLLQRGCAELMTSGSTPRQRPLGLNSAASPAAFAGLPLQRGGAASDSCLYCLRLAKNKRLRWCELCRKHYCGRRSCRSTHAKFCAGHRPHWGKNYA